MFFRVFLCFFVFFLCFKHFKCFFSPYIATVRPAVEPELVKVVTDPETKKGRLRKPKHVLIDTEEAGEAELVAQIIVSKFSAKSDLLRINIFLRN